MSVLVCGSIAFDSIMIFPDKFKDHILPDKLHILNVSFLVPDMHQSYGGCAANIAYGLQMLGEDVYLMGTVGRDFGRYRQWLDKCNINQQYVVEIEDQYTAHAYIVTDQDDNQITAFHPGAMSYCHFCKVPTDQDVRIGLISPEGREGMLQHAEQMAQANIPYIFDPGQGVPMFNREELDFFLEHADWLACNDYEAQMILGKIGITLKELIGRVKGLIVTNGNQGSVIYIGDKEIKIPPVIVDDVVDPTGCGDAYRSGIIHGLLNNMDWETTGRIASLMGAVKVQSRGTQQYSITPAVLIERFQSEFGYRPE